MPSQSLIDLKRFGRKPFLMINTPTALQREIEREYKNMVFEDVSQSGITNGNGGEVNLKQSVISTRLHDLCFDYLEPFVSSWASTEVERSWGYGMRMYGNGSVLKMHRDRVDTHVLSCIIHVDDKTNEPWPLEFVDHEGNLERIYFRKGQTLLYESLCPHGRTIPLNGDYYCNMYFHWRPKDWNPTPYKELKVWFENSAEAQSSR